MTLYNLKSADGDWRITKFTNDLEPEGSYLVSADACTCPAGVRPTCRHRQMLPKFLAAGAEDSGMFFHFETEQFLAPDLGESNSSSDFSEADDPSADSEVEFAENVSAELLSQPMHNNIPCVEVESIDGEILEPNDIGTEGQYGRELMAKDITPSPYPYTEETCPGHIASNNDPKICEHCGTHIDSLRPDDEYGITPLISSGDLDQLKADNAERSAELKSHPAVVSGTIRRRL